VPRAFIMALAVALYCCPGSTEAQLSAGELADHLPGGRGLLLPVRNLAGSTAAAEAVEATLRLLTAGLPIQPEAFDLRSTLRRLRIRDLSQAGPEQVRTLADELGVNWFLSVTLLEAELSLVPQITLTASLFEADSSEHAWLGFISRSGVDEVGWLGLGGVENLRSLAELCTAELIQGPRVLHEKTKRSQQPRTRRSRYLRKPIEVSESSVVATVPFNSLTDKEPLLAATIVSRALDAALFDCGYRVLLPGAVRATMRENRTLLFGEITGQIALPLRQDHGAHWVLTGMVETFEMDRRQGRPDPRVAFSARLVEAESGQLGWLDGVDRRGSDRQGLFGRGRTYTRGALTFGLAKSMVQELGGNCE